MAGVILRSLMKKVIPAFLRLPNLAITARYSPLFRAVSLQSRHPFLAIFFRVSRLRLQLLAAFWATPLPSHWPGSFFFLMMFNISALRFSSLFLGGCNSNAKQLMKQSLFCCFKATYLLSPRSPVLLVASLYTKTLFSLELCV